MSAKRKAYRMKSYVTSFANSDSKIDLHSSREEDSVSPSKEYLERTQEKNQSHAFHLSVSNEMGKSISKDGINHLESNPYSQLVTTSSAAKL